MLTLNQIKVLQNDIDRIIEPITIDKQWGFDLPWETFVRGVALTNPQVYGIRIQNRVIQECSLIRTTGDGDLVDPFGDHVEIKTSLIRKNAPNNKMNLVQIRPWERCTYLFVAFDLRNDGFEIYSFKLSRGEMEKEIELLGAQSAHGSALVAAQNTFVEKAIRIPVDNNDYTFKRWCENYKSNFLIDF